MPGATSTHLSALPPRALNVEGAAAPEWVELIPAGAVVAGFDGRRWANPDPAAVVAATNRAGQPIPVDWEHATEIRAPKGEDAPAAGWVSALEVREGAVWGRVEWTARAANQVAAKEYRFVSPVFLYGRAAPNAISRLTSVALTNTPNLQLTALNRREPARASEETSPVTLIERLRAALALPADANDDAIVAAASEAKAANSRSVDLTKYAPRADLETATNRATTLQTELDAIKSTAQDAAIEAALNAAQSAGKITPASRPEYLAMCKREGGLESFTRLAVTLPVLAGAGRTGAEKKPDEAAAAGKLTDEEKAVCRALGQSEADFLKSKEA